MITPKPLRYFTVSIYGIIGLAIKFILADKIAITADLFMSIFLSVGGVILVANLIFDLVENGRTKKLNSFYPTLLGIMLAGLMYVEDYFLALRDKSPVLFHAVADDGYNALSIELREDSTYKILDGSGFGYEYYRGSYSLHDSELVLNTKNTRVSELFQGRIVIRPNSCDSSIQKYLHIHSKRESGVEEDFILRITEDKRSNTPTH